MSRSGQGSADGPFVTPPPNWGDDPTSTPRRRRPDTADGASSRSTVLVVTLISVVLIVIAAAGVLLFGSHEEDRTFLPVDDPAAALEAPPSERNQPTTTGELDPATSAEPLPREDAPARTDYTPLDCVFVGTAIVEPEIGTAAGQPLQMQLDAAANFECLHEDGQAAGSVALDVEFEQLDLVSGTGRGEGRIEWDTVPPSRLPTGALAPGSSTTDTEVEFILPQIIVWITVTDGPFEGFRGKLVLDDWELRQLPELDRTEVVFAPTGFGLGPRT